MEYINSFTEVDLCNFILKTKESLYICLPLLQPLVLTTIKIINKNDSKISINIGVDFSPETFRQGYGEIKSYNDIISCSYNTLNMQDNRISFVVSDNLGYYLFFESRYFIPANKATLNAVQIDPISIVRLKQHFFNTCKTKDNFSNDITNAMIDESIRLKNIDYPRPDAVISSVINAEKYNNVITELKKNPPLRPDYQRIVQIYVNKLQYIQLEFEGANLQSKKIILPPKAMPIKSAEFKKKLESKLSLFDEDNRAETFELLKSFKNKLQKFREKYTVSLKSRKESVISKLNKPDFQVEFENLKKELEDIKLKSMKKVSEQIDNTRKLLEIELDEFYYLNFENLIDKSSLFDDDEGYKRRESHIAALETIYHIKWPKAYELLNGFSLKVFYSEITFEDLNNKTLLKELKDKNFISEADVNSVADFNLGIEVEK
jgi:hypothetical protein